MKRLNPFTAAPEGVAALVKVEDYVRASGLEPRLVALVRTRVSQMNGCAYCLHMHTEEALQAGEQEVRLHVLDAWRESAMYSERERAALNWAESLTNIAQTHAPDAGIRAGARPVFRQGAGGSVDCYRHDQWLEPSCHRVAGDTSGGQATRRVAASNQRSAEPRLRNCAMGE